MENFTGNWGRNRQVSVLFCLKERKKEKGAQGSFKSYTLNIPSHIMVFVVHRNQLKSTFIFH